MRKWLIKECKKTFMKTSIKLIFFLLSINLHAQSYNKNLSKLSGIKQKDDVAIKWSKLLNQAYFKEKIDSLNSIQKNLDLSLILTYDSSSNPYLSQFIGAFGENFQRTDLQLQSVKHEGNQAYSIQFLCKRINTIDTLRGQMNLNSAYNILIEPFDVYLYSFNYKLFNSDTSFYIQGINAISFYLENEKVNNFWFDDGTFRDYIRTFVGSYADYQLKKSGNFIFATEASGLYNHLPFCDELYYTSKDCEEYYNIKSKYLKSGWQDYEKPSKDFKWWQK